MKIAYDVSILGQGYINPKARTGIYRVVKSLLFELIKQQNIEFQVVALNKISSIWDDISVELYLEQIFPDLSLDYYSGYEFQDHLRNFYRQLVKLQTRLINISENKSILVYKVARALQIISEILTNPYLKLSYQNQGYHIYHSLYYPLIDSEIINHAARILMIPDLIPHLFPEFVTSKVYSRFYQTIESIDFNKDWIICISEKTKQDFCEYTKMKSSKVFVTPLAASNHFYSVNNQSIIKETLLRYKIPENRYLLSLCTLEPRKNLAFLIRCFAKIISENPNLDINLVLVGVSGWKNANIFQEALNNPIIKSRIIFTGYIQDQDLSAIYSGATGFVYPSLYEGFGLPPLEAMQCGTPVITSNTSSLPEVVGDAGLMIDPRQEDELCQAILNLVNNSELRTNLSQKGIERASEFSWKKCAEETVKVYNIASENK